MMSNPFKYSGDRFRVTYEIRGDRAQAEARAQAICVEQTIEFPADLVRSEVIAEHVIGKVHDISEAADGAFEAHISYAVEVTGFELVQFLNVLFGNSSLKPGIKVKSIALPEVFLEKFRGPRYGKSGIRELLGVQHGPLLCAALKPMGRSAAELAQLASAYTQGGVDFIKEDHGLADQPFSTFEERVPVIAEAVTTVNANYGTNAVYLPNTPGPVTEVLDRAHFAKEAGAGGLLVSPGLLGFDIMRILADEDDLALPIMCHPALLGSFTVGKDHGISHGLIHGVIPRLAGADMVIFAVYGGRFSCSKQECEEIIRGCEREMGNIRSAFPTPGGGMRLDRVEEMADFFNGEAVFLIGGNLQRGKSPAANSSRFREIIDRFRN